MAASVPNQNNINDIIKSQVKSINSTISIIIEAASSKVIKRATAEIESLKQYKDIIESTLGNDGILTNITNAIQNIANSSNLTAIKTRILKRNILKMANLTNFILGLNIDSEQIKVFQKAISPLTTLYDNISKLFEAFNDITIPKAINVKIVFIRKTLKKIAKMGFFFNRLNLMIPMMTTGLESLKMLDTYMTMLSDVFANIKSINVGPATFIKLKLIPIILKRTTHIIYTLNHIAKIIAATGGLKDSLVLSTVFNMFESVFESINNIKIGLLFDTKLNRINRSLGKIKRILWSLNKLFVKPGLIAKLILIQSVFTQLGLLFLSIIIISPVVLLVVPVLLLLVGGVLILKMATNLIVKMLKKMAMADVIIGLALLVVISSFFLLLSITFLVIAMTAKPIVESSIYILGLMGVIMLVTAGAIGIGMLMSSLIGVSAVAIIGLGLLLIVIGLITVMALMLRVIQMINLDPEIIKKNVQTVLDTAELVMKTIFKEDKKKENESDKSWIASIIEFIGGSLATIVKAIMAVAYLAVIVVAILLILIIAGQLERIQNISLNSNKITSNVSIVIDTAQLIIDTIFNPGEKDSKGTKKSWIESVIDFFGGPLVSIIKAIMAVAYLAVIIVTILLINIIAGELRLLQTIKLDANKITSNVSIVIDTAQLVIDALFDRKDKDSEGTKKSWIESVIDLFGGPLLSIIKAIMAVAFLAITIASIALINIIANQLKTLQEIQLDGAAISKNVETVCAIGQTVVDAICNREDSKESKNEKSWIRSIFKFLNVGGLINIIDAIMALAWLGTTLAMISMIKLLSEQLAYISTFDCKPDQVKAKVLEIIDCAETVINAIMNRKDPADKLAEGSEEKQGFLKKLFSNLGAGIKFMAKLKWLSTTASICGSIHEIAIAMAELKNLPDLTDAKNKVTTLCNTVDQVIKMVVKSPDIPLTDGFDSRMWWMYRISNAIKDFNRIPQSSIKKYKGVLEENTKFVKQLNDIDAEKLKLSAKMFQSMALFSSNIKGNFKELAETINEDLMPILEELKDIMDKIPEKLEVGFQNTSASIGAATAPTTASNTEAQVLRENPNLSAQDVERIVRNRMNERAAADANGVSAKIDELIALLKGFGGTQVVVRTI